jgi:hypothetical protein
MPVKRYPLDVQRGAFPVRRAFMLALAALLIGSFVLCCRSKPAEPDGARVSEEQNLRQKIATLTRHEQLLAAEISLAKNPVPYIAVDLVNRKVDLKVQGHSLRSFTIIKFSSSRSPSFLTKTWIGIEARPLQSTTRGRVVPGSGEAASSSIATRDPWGPKRMPSDYDLVCKDNQALTIRALPSEQSHSRLTRWIVSSYRQVRDWTRDVLGRHSSAYRESLELWLTEDDARLLFWSLPKQFGILISNPV